MTVKYSGTISGTGVPASMPQLCVNRLAISLDFGTATVALEWCLNGTDWKVFKSWTADANEVVEFGIPIPVRLNCSAYTSEVTWAIMA